MKVTREATQEEREKIKKREEKLRTRETIEEAREKRKRREEEKHG